MSTLVTADGRTLRRQAPTGTYVAGGQFGAFPPMWSDGSTDATDGTPAISYSTIYETQPIVAAAINKLTRQIGTLPLKVYRRKGVEGDRERVRDHPLTTLLEKPYERRGPVQLKQWIAFPSLLHGNSLIAKYRESDGAPPTMLVPLDWRYVSAWAQPGGPVEWWQTTQFDEPRYVAAADALHFAWEGPTGIAGVSPLKQLGVTVKLEDAIQRHSAALFANGGHPKSALIPPDGYRWAKGEKAEVGEAIREFHGGPDKAGNVALLGAGFDWKALQFTAVEAELIAQRQVNREETGAVYDLAGPLIGDLTHGTYSNVEELGKQLYRIVLRPWLVMIEETIKAQLIDPEPTWRDLFVEFDLGEVLRGSKAEEIDAAVKAFTNGLMTLNEIRQMLNLPPIKSPEADMPHIPTNNLGPMGATPPTAPPPPVSGAPAAGPEQPPNPPSPPPTGA